MIIEIRAGEGGKDAEEFTGELAASYQRYLSGAG